MKESVGIGLEIWFCFDLGWILDRTSRFVFRICDAVWFVYEVYTVKDGENMRV